MCNPVFALAASAFSAYQHYSQGKEQARALKYNASVQEANAELSRRAAADAVSRGAQEAGDVRDRARRQNARGRAVMAGSGLVTDTGSNLDIQTDNTVAGEVNALTALNNAQREAYGYKIQEMDSLNAATASRQSAKSARRNASLSAIGSLVTGAASYGSNAGFFQAKSYGPQNSWWARNFTGGV